MSVFLTCFNWMLDNEDATHAYAVVPDSPPGSFAISGINSSSFPSQFEAIQALPQNQRGPAIQNFYQTQFWSIWFGQLISDEVAKRVYDASVNMGGGTAVHLLQQAVNDSSPATVLNEDSQWGPKTVGAVNACDPVTLVAAFKSARAFHYECIVKANPADEKYLAGWLARAQK
jgi:lysozyme family protein